MTTLSKQVLGGKMAKEAGFTSMAGPKAVGEIPDIGIGMLGYAFMGKAHTNAYKKLS